MLGGCSRLFKPFSCQTAHNCAEAPPHRPGICRYHVLSSMQPNSPGLREGHGRGILGGHQQDGEGYARSLPASSIRQCGGGKPAYIHLLKHFSTTARQNTRRDSWPIPKATEARNRSFPGGGRTSKADSAGRLSCVQADKLPWGHLHTFLGKAAWGASPTNMARRTGRSPEV